MKLLFIIGFLTSTILFLIHFSFVGFGVYGDGVGYYSYTHALYFHHNLDFHQEFQYYSHFQKKEKIFSRIFWDITPTETGLLPNHWSIGPGILWLPFMLVGDVLAQALSLLGIHFPLDGFSPPYEISIGIGNILYGYLGLLFLYKFLRNYFSQNISLLSTISIYLATNLVYYISLEPVLSHGVSFFVASLFLFIWQQVARKKTIRGYILLGLIGGLLTTIRPYDAVWVFIPLVQLFTNVIASEAKQSHMRLPRLLRNLAMTLALVFSWLIGFTPQLLSQKIIYGHFWYQPYIFEGGGGTLALTHNYLFDTLFSLKRGLLFWSPILLLSFIGFWWGRKKYFGLILIFLFIFFIQWQVIGHWAATLSAGFGARMYISSFPLFAIGLALFFQKVESIKFITIIIIIFVTWNLLLLNQFFVDKRLLEGQLDLTQIIDGQFTNLQKAPDKLFKTYSKNR